MMQPPNYEMYAILVADMVGYSAWLTEQPAATHTAFTHHLRSVFAPCVRQHGGRIVKTTGDGFVGILKNSAAAESCAQQIQNNLSSQHDSNLTSDSLIEYRIAIHRGDIIVESNDVFGLPVNIAIHMQSLAEPGGICISDVVFNQLSDSCKEAYKYIGRKYLKNIPDAISIFCRKNPEQHLLSSRSMRVLHERRRSFLSPPARLGLAEFDLAADDKSGFISRLVQDTLFHGMSRYHDLIVTVPLGASLTARKALQLSATLIKNQFEVDYVLFGSIFKSNEIIFISAHLQAVRDNSLLWSNRLRIASDNFDTIEDNLLDQLVIPALFYLQRNEIDSQDRSWRSVDENRFRVAQRLLSRGTMESTSRARQILSEILDRCGDVGDVHIALARAEHLHGRLLAGQEFVDALERARKHAVLAIEIDDLNAQAHSELALQEMFLRRQTVAEGIYDRAMRLNPYDPMLQADWAGCLTVMGKAQEAMPILEKVAAGWPRDRSWVEWNLCDTLWALDRPDRIVEILDHRLELPHVHRYLAAANAKLGRIEQARQHAERVRGYQPSFSTKKWGMVVPYTESDTGEHYVEFLARAGL